MKNSLIEIKDGKSFYILEEVVYENKNYALAVLIDDNKVASDMNVVVLEYYFKDGNITVSEIENDDIASTVTTMLKEKIQRDNK